MSAVPQPPTRSAHAGQRSDKAADARDSRLDPRSAFSRRDVSRVFGRVLRTARDQCGLTQEQLAERAQLDRTYPSLLERGLRQPTLTVLFQLAGALGRTPQSLLDATLSGLADGTSQESGRPMVGAHGSSPKVPRATPAHGTTASSNSPENAPAQRVPSAGPQPVSAPPRFPSGKSVETNLRSPK
jgi:DNA-binding XRE family transcriptional regulator